MRSDEVNRAGYTHQPHSHIHADRATRSSNPSRFKKICGPDAGGNEWLSRVPRRSAVNLRECIAHFFNAPPALIAIRVECAAQDIIYTDVYALLLR